jgi:ribosomal protein L39E
MWQNFNMKQAMQKKHKKKPVIPCYILLKSNENEVKFIDLRRKL